MALAAGGESLPYGSSVLLPWCIGILWDRTTTDKKHSKDCAKHFPCKSAQK